MVLLLVTTALEPIAVANCKLDCPKSVPNPIAVLFRPVLLELPAFFPKNEL